MKVILTGASGMVGKGVLFECLDDPDVEQVLCVGRGASGVSHPKVQELVLADLTDYAAVEVARDGTTKPFLTTADINALAGAP